MYQIVLINTTDQRKPKRQPIKEKNGKIREFPNREAAKQFVRNHPGTFWEAQYEIVNLQKGESDGWGS